MPTYEYICEGCGAEIERFQSITAGALRKCPSCGKNKLKRLIGTGGSGFYETDYRSESYKKGAESEKKSREKATEKKDKGEKKAPKSESKSKSTSKDKKKSA